MSRLKMEHRNKRPQKAVVLFFFFLVFDSENRDRKRYSASAFVTAF